MVANRRRADGFTLLEVMVVTVIMGILMAVGVPGIKTLLNVQKMKSATFDLVTTAMLARSEAIKWGSGNPTATTTPDISIVAAGTSFTNGWCIVFTSGTACSLTAPADAVMQIVKPTANMTYGYLGTGTTVITPVPITFTRTGRLAGGVPVTVRVTDIDGYATPRCVTFDINGNARVRAMPDHTTAC
jgi:prepilin-type N-terminal cleavage/methylation domain-containing protein